ncbi:hypothetical protein BH11PLA2_BH11PLA2_08040 [soil metagenome]
MTPRQLFLLSPYRPPTSYPVSLSAEEASAWLNAWAALWHPLALRGAILPPLPASSYDHNEPAAGAIYALPAGPSLYLEADWKTKVEAAPAFTFDATPDRKATLASLKLALGNDPEFDTVPPEVVRWFAGIGFGHLMLDTLFDAMNHDKLLDLEAFWQDVQDATAVVHDVDAVRAKLTEAALKLQSAREGLLPSGAHLVELIALDVTKQNAGWPAPFRVERPVTMIASSASLLTLRDSEPKHFATLKAAPPGSIDFAVGVTAERDDTLLPVESQLWSMTQARTDAKSLLDIDVRLFARRTAEYHANLPGWLSMAGFTGAILLNLDSSAIPSFSSSLIQWPGPEGKIINAFTRMPLPASDPQTFFNLGYHLYDTSQRESTPLFAMIHTGEPPAAGYDEWLAVDELAPVFGEWTGIAKLLEDSHNAEYVSVPAADDFSRDSLDFNVTKLKLADPVSRFARHNRLRKKLDSNFTLAALQRSLTPPTSDDDVKLKALEGLETAFETSSDETVNVKLDDAERYWSDRLNERILARSAPNTPGYLILNTCGFTRRVGLEFPGEPGPIPVVEPVKASEYESGMARVVVEVPGLGFAWIPRGSASVGVPKARIKTAENTIVRNEFMEAEFDAATGGLRAVRDVRHRVHRLGQLLVYNPGSRMVATSVKVTHAGAILGEVTSEGRIVDEQDATLATFRQRVRAWVGRPALELRIEITPVAPTAGYPWHHYYGARFGWRDDRAALYRGVQGSNAVTGLLHPVSPDYLEVRYGRERSFLFTGGLPYLQKHGSRMIDVVLNAEGETTTSFDLLIAFDREHPMPTAAGWTAPTQVIAVDKGAPPMGTSGWLASHDLPSLLLTSLRPCSPGEGMSRAVTARFTETAGFASSAELRFARDTQRVYTADLNGVTELPVTLTGDSIPMACSANELVNFKIEWA